ncbi:polysaccharide biosynthesis protein [Anaerostipes hadrus]|jgi:FlaA1/EpsC-like NDP-sugar epimerase|uniref:polysaccharide biosynthesis protein n=1 Tax=Anaerostipes hadrus TaxID=649756 RepID=UPI00156F8381|nr:nucleoside-diphosphate sugar epimerase/dehydratase [Anaerostipes hadrus]NSG73004.1 polysaccharide biosynthesis protein [Anaerostipes hadrus]
MKLKSYVNRKRLAIELVLFDIIAIQLAAFLAILTRFEFRIHTIEPLFIDTLVHYAVLNTFCSICIFAAYRMYSTLWSFASIMDFFNVVKAVLISSVFQFIGIHMLAWPIPRSFIVLYIGWLGIAAVFPRMMIRILRGGRRIPLQAIGKQAIPVMLIGAGEAGSIILQEFKNSKFVEKEIVCVIDDDPKKWGTFIHGVPVVGGRRKITQSVVRFGIQEIVLAIPTLKPHERKNIINICQQTGCKMSTLPGIYQLINCDVKVSMLRDVQIEDLLGREAVRTDLESIMSYVKDQKVMVTGGGGSIGSELCRQIADDQPKQLIIIDNYENAAYELQMELGRKHPELDVIVLIVSVQNRRKIREIFEQYKPDLVFHAAAHKHVPLMEYSPCEAIKNNVFGTMNVASEANRSGVKRMVLISTDKAVRPTNIMGASKRICEMVIQTYNQRSKTEYVAVRFGNVLGSNGSVVPLFKQQIREGGPVTVTHPDIIRYFMTIPEAVSLVLQAGAYAQGGEIFILDMGEPVKILDLAENMIRLSGLVPGEDIEIKFTGLRPGEKLYEELLIDDDNKKETANKRIFIGQPIKIDEAEFDEKMKELEKATFSEDENIRQVVKKLVPEYTIQQINN